MSPCDAAIDRAGHRIDIAPHPLCISSVGNRMLLRGCIALLRNGDKRLGELAVLCRRSSEVNDPNAPIAAKEYVVRADIPMQGAGLMYLPKRENSRH